MHRISCLALLIILIFVFTLSNCCELTDQTKISDLYLNNKEVFLASVESGDYSEVEKLKGIKQVYDYDGEVTFLCGSKGLAVSGSSYGILYTDRDFFTEEVPEGWTVTIDGNTVRKVYERRNRVIKYVSLGNGFWYFEDHD